MTNEKKISVIIAAAGSGSRFEQDNFTSKQFLLLDEKPLLVHSLEKFVRIKNICEIIIVSNDINLTSELLVKYDFSNKVKIKVVEGSKLRQDSVYNGFCKVDNSISLVVIHDVARPLFKIRDLEKCIEAALVSGAAILAVPVVDTIKCVKSDKDRLVVKNTLDRANLYLVQTPQVFSYRLLSNAYKMLNDPNQVVTDEASMVEIIGEEVELVFGNRTNIKITYPEDLKIAEAIEQKKSTEKSTNLFCAI